MQFRIAITSVLDANKIQLAYCNVNKIYTSWCKKIFVY